MKTVVITGASSGIGQSAALYFNKMGWRVIATMRSPEKSSELKNVKDIHLLKLDVTDSHSIDIALIEIMKITDIIDVVINNAGYGMKGIFEYFTPKECEQVYNVNVFGVMNITRAFLPQFRKQKKGMFINISSMGGYTTAPLVSVYNSSKWAIEGYSEGLTFELEDMGIVVKIIQPGTIKTSFQNSTVVKDNKSLSDYSPTADVYMEKLLKNVQIGNGPDQVAKTIYKAATDGKKRLRYRVGVGAKPAYFIRRILPFPLYRTIIKRVFK